MSSSAECKRCGDSIHSGPVVCWDCLNDVLEEVDQHLSVTTAYGWTYAKDVVSVIRDAFSAPPKKMPPASLPEEQSDGSA